MNYLMIQALRRIVRKTIEHLYYVKTSCLRAQKARPPFLKASKRPSQFGHV